MWSGGGGVVFLPIIIPHQPSCFVLFSDVGWVVAIIWGERMWKVPKMRKIQNLKTLLCQDQNIYTHTRVVCSHIRWSHIRCRDCSSTLVGTNGKTGKWRNVKWRWIFSRVIHKNWNPEKRCYWLSFDWWYDILILVTGTRIYFSFHLIHCVKDYFSCWHCEGRNRDNLDLLPLSMLIPSHLYSVDL